MSDALSTSDGLVIQLRPMTHADVQVMCALEEAIFAEDPWTPGMVDEELRAAGRHYVAACVSTNNGPEEVVGYAGITLGPDADVMTIGVLPAWRGRGVGARLLADLLATADATGSERIFLEVRASNDAAQGLYRRYGFETIGYIRNYFRHPREDAVTMLRERPEDASVH